MTKKLSPEQIAEMSEDCQCSCKELEQYKAWWERDSTALGKALNEVSSLRAVREESRAAIEQLHAAVKTAQELAARRLMEINRLQSNQREHIQEITELTQNRDDYKADYLRMHKMFMDLKYPDTVTAHEPCEQRCEDRITLNDVVWRCTKPANHREHDRQPEAALRDVPYLSRHDWQLLPGGSYQCLRCSTQCLEAHDAKLCSVNAQRTSE
jgi:hypothetical protein